MNLAFYVLRDGDELIDTFGGPTKDFRKALLFDSPRGASLFKKTFEVPDRFRLADVYVRVE